MIDNIIASLNHVTVSNSENVVLMSNAFQMLFALKKGLDQEDKAKNAKIETLKEQLKAATKLTPDNDDAEIIGGQHYEYHFGGVDNGEN